MFSPELSQHWVSDQAIASESPRADARDEEALSPAQQEALDALVDRINAARSVF